MAQGFLNIAIAGTSLAVGVYVLTQVPSDNWRYGTLGHQIRHWYGGWSGRIAFVRCENIDDVWHDVPVHGLVCSECGYTSPNRILGRDEPVENGAPHLHYTPWITNDSLKGLRVPENRQLNTHS